MLYVHRVPTQYGYPTQELDMFSPEEQYYRDVAAEHNRRAHAAMAMAQQERQRAFLARQRQQALRQQALRRESPFGFRSPYNRSVRPMSWCGAPAMDDYYDAFIEEQRREAEERKRKDREEALRQLHHSQVPQGASDFLVGLLSALGQGQDDAPVSPNPTPSKKVRFDHSAQPQQAEHEVPAVEATPAPSKLDKGKAKEVQAPEPEESRPAPRRPEDVWSGLFNALSGGRSVPEKEAILRDLGLKLPATATQPKKPAPKARSTSVPASTRVPIPINVPSPSTPPATTPAPEQSSPRHASFNTIDAIQSKFDALKASFTLPATLDFDPSSTSEDIKLTYTPANAPVHTYESELMKLFTKLDGIDSEGAASIRGARKALVLAVEGELEKLDADKKAAWEESVKAKEVEPVEAIEVDVADATPAEAVEEVVGAVEEPATSDAMVVEPATEAVNVPLPADDLAIDVANESASDAISVDEPAARAPTSGPMVIDSSSTTTDSASTVESSQVTATPAEDKIEEDVEVPVEVSSEPTAVGQVAFEETLAPFPETEDDSEPSSSPTQDILDLPSAEPSQPSQQPDAESDDVFVEAFSQPASPSVSAAPSDTLESADVEDSVIVEAPAREVEPTKKSDDDGSGSENDFEML